MLTQAQITLDSVVSFELIANQSLPTTYQRVKILGILDADTARYWVDTAAMHARLAPSLPPSAPNRHDGYHYVKIMLASGQTTAIGLPWIRQETYVEHSTRVLQFKLQGVSPEDENRLWKALSANGFTAYEVTYPDA